MADVIKKVIDANDYVNGAIVTGVDKVGNKDTLPQEINDNGGIAGISGVLDTRFDDAGYYCG